MTVDLIGEAVVPLPVGEIDIVTVGSDHEDFWATYVAGEMRERHPDRAAAVNAHPRWTHHLVLAAWGES
jgi:hypothetical protein